MVTRDVGRDGKRKWGQEGLLGVIGKGSLDFLPQKQQLHEIVYFSIVSSPYLYIAFSIILFVLTRLNEKF